MKKLINSVGAVVSEALHGLVRLHPNLALLAGETTVVRADAAAFRASGKVAVVTGGGAGHEPAHAGYVGRGMLTAAVSGDVFASPGTDAVLTALRTVGGPAGVLLIVKNYTGDRLNFGLAAEIARAEGIPTEIVVVDDDAALGSAEETAGRRGIAGTVFVHKVAGAAAEAGLPLAEVRRQALDAIAAVSSMGVALSGCTVPAAGKPNFLLADNQIELGLGIHGEPGVENIELRSAREIVAMLVDKIVADRGFAAGEEVALLVNNLGATPPMEQYLVADEAIVALEGRGLVVARAWCGTFLTAIDMAGISLSVMRLDAERRQALDLPVEAPAWPKALGMHPRPVTVIAGTTVAATAETGTGNPASEPFIAAVTAACEALIGAEARLTEMDQAVGDGDIGRSLANGAAAVLARIETLRRLPVDAALRDISGTLRRSVGGTSGPLYAILAMAAANALVDAPALSGDRMAEAFAAGVAALGTLGGARAGDKTMMDALLPAADAATATPGAFAGRLAAAAEAARAGADRTAGLVARRGRASYLGARAVGHKDPGAEAVAIWLSAVAKAATR